MNPTLSLNPNMSKTINVFLVEDYHLTRLGLIAAMKSFPTINFVGEAESAEEALSKLSYKLPDVLLLDLGLPGMDGIQMAETVKKRWPNIKIVVLTSHSGQEEIISAFAAGAQAYALKTISSQRLSEVIETVHEGAVWIDPTIASVVLDMLNAPSTINAHHRTTSPKRPNNAGLTEREMEVLKLIVDGKNNPEIADLLCISNHTAKAHVGSILNKLAVDDRVQAAVKALKESIV